MNPSTTDLNNLPPEAKRQLLKQILHEKTKQANLTYPLSQGQQALWFHHQEAPHSAAYHVAWPAHIFAAFDLLLWQQVFQQIKRHPCLRSTFSQTADGQLWQTVSDHQPLILEQVDASETSWQELQQLVAQAYQRPFDLEQGPLWRINFFIRSPQEHILLVTFHHIIFDGWSLRLFTEELLNLYTTLQAKLPTTLSPLPQQYHHYVQWQNQLLTSAEGERLWQYWQQQLAGELPTLQLPTDRPYPLHRSHQGKTYHLQLPAALTPSLRTLMQTSGATLYMILLAAFQILLHRYSGQTDILVGSPMSGRQQPNWEKIIGYFVNIVVLRANCQHNPPFTQFLDQVRQTVLGALAHQEYPFPLLVRKLPIQRELSRSPIFQTMFTLQKFQPSGTFFQTLLSGYNRSHANEYQPLKVNVNGLSLAHFPLAQQEGQFELSLGILEQGESLNTVWQYSTDIFDQATIERMAHHYQTLLASIVLNPQATIGELALLTSKERYQALVEWNRTQADYPRELGVHQLIEAQVARTPTAIALQFNQETLNYQELNSKANQLAQQLHAQGIKQGSYVPVLMTRSLEVPIAFLAVMKTGAAFVPLDIYWPASRIAKILQQLDNPIILTNQNHLNWASTYRVILVNIAQLNESVSNLNLPVNATDPIYVIYTSGSTGEPKGAINQHRGIVNRLWYMNQTYGDSADDVVLQTSYHHFDSAIWQLFWPLIKGAKTVIPAITRGFDPHPIIELIHQEQITFTDFVPSVLELVVHELFHHSETATSWGKQLRRILVGGEAMNPQTIAQLQTFYPQIGITNTYGPAETSIGVIFYAVPNPCLNPIPIGKPIANVKALVLDNYLNIQPIGVPGELYIGGDCVGLGYLKNAVETQARFISNPFAELGEGKLYKTGDLVRYLADGNLDFLGRIDQQVKIHGVRIELGEIEAILAQHAAVQDKVVMIQAREKRLVAYVVPNEGYSIIPSELRAFLKQRLPEYMIPTVFIKIEALPVTPNGKVDRQALQQLASPSTAVDNVVIPRDSLELELSHIWQTVLGKLNIGVKDNFFELGGHSILAVRLLSMIKQRFGKTLPIASLFQNATIEQLATLLRQQIGKEVWNPLVTIQPLGQKLPFFCVHGVGGNVLDFYHLARHLGSEQPFYGLQAVGLDGDSTPYHELIPMARHYLEAIRTVQAEGPYLLGGYSFGALVAVEMARQLLAQGQTVAQLVIFDSLAQSLNRQLQPLNANEVELLIEFTKFLTGGKSLIIDYSVLSTLAPNQRLSYLHEQLIQTQYLPLEADRKQLQGLIQVYQANRQIHYLPPTALPVPIHLFKAEFHEEEVNQAILVALNEPSWGWQACSSESVQIHTVPGNHFTMLMPPQVQMLAKQLAEGFA